MFLAHGHLPCSYVINPLYRNPRSSLRKTECILNRIITRFYNSDDVNTTAADLRQTKTRPISFQMIDSLLYETKVTGGDKI